MNNQKSKKALAFTFDDGPTETTTRILDVLEKNNLRASFAVQGNRIEENKDILLRAFNMNCDIINHSFDHANLTEISKEEARRQLIDTNLIIKKITGIAPRLFRSPYLALNDDIYALTKELNFSIINFSIYTEDWRVHDSNEIFNCIIKNAFDGGIVLMHDVHLATAEAVERAIPVLIQNEYELLTISQLSERANIELEAGRVYNSII